MKILYYLFLFSFYLIGCKSDTQNQTTTQNLNKIECNENGCSGTYVGKEFINGQDVAHQFSNKMSKAVGDQLKECYQQQDYKNVDFKAIKMTTAGMGSGTVNYTLTIPFMAVNSKCEAFTSFDHVGGWNHQPALERRKKELKHVTLEGQKLEISELKQTKEGLQEYWIQWKNKNLQSTCK